MTINLAPLNQKLRVVSYSDQEINELSDLESRLMHLGFISGAYVVLKKKAPLYQEPLLVEVRGRLIALTKSEAELIQVEVLDS